MKQLRFCAILFLLLGEAFCGARQPVWASGDMLARMSGLNPHLRSYQAAIHVDIALHTFPYISPSLDGMYYHKEPSKDKIAFNTVPAIAAQFNKIYPHVESPSRWKSVFVVTNQGDDGSRTTFKLVPRVRGRIDHITVKVDDKTATIPQMTWNYNDGGFATLNQTFTQVRGNYIANSQTGHVEFPNYKADVTSSFSNFKINPPIPDSVFRQN
ncbi:MAG: hypothetical protein ABR584_04410 [Candidatus Baltobacteraceae bacterium]